MDKNLELKSSLPQGVNALQSKPDMLNPMP